MFDLTRQERQIIIFLFAITLAGMGIEYLAKKIKPLEKRHFLEHLGKVDLNTVDVETLKSLPGIGEKLAGRIIEYREENNGFTDLDELEKVKGIRRNLIGKLRECVYIR